MPFDKELLLKRRLAELEVPLDGFPDPVRVRALTRDEVADIRDEHRDADGEYDVLGMENAMVALALVDPELTLEEVREWATVAPAGEITKVAYAIQQLSGLTEEATKSGLPRNRQQRRAAVRASARRKAR